MNEYIECLYNYVMEDKFRELAETREYITLDRIRKDAERALTETLTKEQIELLDTYMEQETSVEALELRYLFCKALSLARTMYLGQAG